MKSNTDLEELRQTFIDKIEKVVQSAREYSDGMERFAYLWKENKEKSLTNFLEQKDTGPEEAHSYPSLEQFKAKIDEYERIYSDVRCHIYRPFFENHFVLLYLVTILGNWN